MGTVHLGECPVTWRFVSHGLAGRHRPRATWAVPENALGQELPEHGLAPPQHCGVQVPGRRRSLACISVRFGLVHRFDGLSPGARGGLAQAVRAAPTRRACHAAVREGCLSRRPASMLWHRAKPRADVYGCDEWRLPVGCAGLPRTVRPLPAAARTASTVPAPGLLSMAGDGPRPSSPGTRDLG
jgi:hypothetical protein